MVIEVVRIGQRVVRDDRVTTHVALVSRSFGAEKIFMTEVNPEIKDTLEKINNTWGGNFIVEFIDNWKSVVKNKKKEEETEFDTISKFNYLSKIKSSHK